MGYLIAAWIIAAMSFSAFVIALIWFAGNVKKMEEMNND